MKVQINNTIINYAQFGSEKGDPLVFLHGFPFDSSMWEPQIKSLPENIRAITLDFRGHGQSDVGNAHYSIEFFADDVIALLDFLGISNAVICGLSMGGYVALRLVERHPDRVNALVLCDTRSESDTNEGRVKRASTVRSVQADGVKGFAENFVKAVFAPRSFETAESEIVRIKNIIENTSPLSICGTLLALAARTDTTESLKRIDVPTLILVGEHDTLTPPSASIEMQKLIHGSELFVVPDAAHMSNLENPEFFNEKLFSFLSRIQHLR